MNGATGASGEIVPRLVGDICATNARFGLISDDGVILNWRTHACDHQPSLIPKLP